MSECARRYASLFRKLLAVGGWTRRNEALMEIVVKHVRTSRHSWLIACDANLCPEDFKKSLRFRSRHMFIKAPREGVSTGRSKGPNGELIERTHDYVIASHGLQEEIKNMEVVRRFRIKTTQDGHFLGRKETTSSRCGVTRKCQKRFQDSAVEGCQEEARR